MTFSFENVDTVSIAFTFKANRAKKCTDNSKIAVIVNVSEPTDSRLSNYTEPPLREFHWDPAQMTFVAGAGKQLLVGWVNQLNTPLNITVEGKGGQPYHQE
jgi:hypothetical protein